MDLSAININYWILQTIAMAITALLLPNLRITGFFGATLMVVALALVNAHLWDAALFFSIPDKFSTQAIVLLVANAGIFWFLVKLLPGIEIDGVLAAIFAPVIFTVCSVIIDQYGSHFDFISLARKGVGYLNEAKEFVDEAANPQVTPGATP